MLAELQVRVPEAPKALICVGTDGTARGLGLLLGIPERAEALLCVDRSIETPSGSLLAGDPEVVEAPLILDLSGEARAMLNADSGAADGAEGEN